MIVSSGEDGGMSAIGYRMPSLKDGSSIHSLVRNSKPLDVNSLYSYLLLTAHFGDTCIVAERGGEIVGYISAYVHPKKDDTLFVWQVAVSEKVRKQGVGVTMLTQILKRSGLGAIRWLETTVSPSNIGSSRMFQSLARKLNTPCQTSVYFSEDLFEGQSHEEEVLFRIGPFSML